MSPGFISDFFFDLNFGLNFGSNFGCISGYILGFDFGYISDLYFSLNYRLKETDKSVLREIEQKWCQSGNPFGRRHEKNILEFEISLKNCLYNFHDFCTDEPVKF